MKIFDENIKLSYDSRKIYIKDDRNIKLISVNTNNG